MACWAGSEWRVERKHPRLQAFKHDFRMVRARTKRAERGFSFKSLKLFLLPSTRIFHINSYHRTFSYLQRLLHGFSNSGMFFVTNLQSIYNRFDPMLLITN